MSEETNSNVVEQNLHVALDPDFDALSKLIDLKCAHWPDSVWLNHPLIEFLHGVNAPRTLAGFKGVALRGLTILDSEDCRLLFSISGSRRKRWRKALHRTIANVKNLADRIFGPNSELKERFLRVEGDGDNPLFKFRIKEHSCCGFLWHSYPHRALDPKLVNVQAAVMGAHVEALSAKLPLDQWIAGTDLDIGTSLSLYHACLAARQFIRRYAEYKPFLVGLPEIKNITQLPATYNAYAEQILADSEESTEPLAKSVAADLKAIVYLVEWGLKTSEHKRRLVKRHNRKRKLPPPPEEIEEVITADGRKFEFHKDKVDENSQESTPAITQVFLTENDPVRESELLKAGDYPGDVLKKLDVLLAGDKTCARMAAGGWVEMRNQLLPGGWDDLAIDELARAFIGLKDRADRNMPFAMEVYALVSALFCTGHTLKLGLPIWVSSTPIEGDRDGLGLILPSSGWPEWRVRALKIPYSDKVPSHLPGGRRIVTSFSLPDIAGGSEAIRRLLELKNISLESGKPVTVLERDPAVYQKMIDAALQEIDPHGRITLRRICGFLFQRVLDRFRDIVTAAFITRTDHLLISARLFYSSLSVFYLRCIYRMVMSDVCAELSSAGYDFPLFPVDPSDDDDGSCVGSPLCPTLITVQQSMERLKTEIKRMLRRVKPDLKRLSNLCSFYVYLWFSCEIAARGVEGCYVSDDELQALLEASGCWERTISRIDKSDAQGTHGRIYSLSAPFIKQMGWLKKLRERVDRTLFGDQPPGPPIYFITDDNERVEIRPKTLEPFLAEFLPFPANFARHLLRSELIEQQVLETRSCLRSDVGFPPEFVDCLLGNWNIGEEPGGQFSTFQYSKYFESFESHVAPFVAGLGFRPLRMDSIHAAGAIE